MEFEWDEAKRALNLAKHGLDFVRTGQQMGAPHVIVTARDAPGETRWLAIGMLGEQMATAVFTWRGDKVRVISLRRARDGERRRYQAIYGG